MGIAYGAAKPGSTGNAARIGIIVDPEGKVLTFTKKASPTDFPTLALGAIPAPG